MKLKVTVDGHVYIVKEPTIRLQQLSKQSGSKDSFELLKNCLESIDSIPCDISTLEKVFGDIPLAHMLAVSKAVEDLMGKAQESVQVEIVF